MKRPAQFLSVALAIAMLLPASACLAEPVAARPIAGTPVLDARYAGRLLQLINDYRGGLGLALLTATERLTELAAEHNENMLHSGRLGHDRFRQRLQRSGSRLCVENVGVGFPYPGAQLNGWIDSPGHRQNLLDPNVRVTMRAACVTFFACS